MSDMRLSCRDVTNLTASSEVRLKCSGLVGHVTTS